LKHFWEHYRRKIDGYFMQDGAIAHTTNYAIDALNEVFTGRLINHRLWTARSPDLNPCDLYLWGNLKKQSVLNYPHTHWMNLCTETITFIEVSELKLVSNNLFKKLGSLLKSRRETF
jgi:hypothetical protein